MNKVKVAFILIYLSITLIANSQQGWRQNEMQIRVDLTNPRHASYLYNFRINGDYFPNHAILFVTPPELEKIKQASIPYVTQIENLNEYYKDFWNAREQYHTYEDIIYLADSLETHFPEICKKYLFGTSIQGRDLVALKISDNVEEDEHEAEVLFDGGIHGDEIGGAENLIRYARDLCLAYGENTYLTGLIDEREIWLYLMVNPDGRANMVRTNVNGVDLNRDWGYMWDAWGGSSGAYSQVETRGLRDCMYNNQFVVHITYHSGTESIGYPWSYRPDPAADNTHTDYLAALYSNLSGYPNLAYGPGYSGIYPINGSSKDSNYGIMGSVSWTMELSYDKQPPPSQIMLYYNRNVPSMNAMIEYAGYGLEGVVTDAVTGEPVPALVLVDDYFQCYTDPVTGDYHKYVLPGTYDIKVIANGYQTQVVEDVVVTELNATVIDIQLEAEEGDYVYKIPSCRIPDNNHADEGNTLAVFGAPDNINYSIGKWGWIVVDMQTPVIDGPGDDFIVYEGDYSPEGYKVFVSETMDGPWELLGEGEGTQGFDLANSGVVETQYIKIYDDGDGSATGPDAGFDLDAIQKLEQISGIYLTMTENVFTEESGNGDGIIDPGEIIGFSVTLQNNGDIDAENIQGIVNSSTGFIQMIDNTGSFGNLEQGQSAEVSFTFYVSELCPVGQVFDLTISVESNNGTYTNSFAATNSIGLISENFETGDLSSFDWVIGGNANWFVTDNNSYEGTYSVRSGEINDSQSSHLSLTLNVTANGNISFARKVSSEASYDFLEFYIDDFLVDSWSGEMDWATVSYPVNEGVHTFRWTYMKDTYVTGGQDCGWIDHIELPPIAPSNMGVLKGYITNAYTGQPVTGASINNVTTSDGDGFYSLDLMEGTYVVCVYHPDYDTLCLEAEITSNDSTLLDFALIPTVGLDETDVHHISVSFFPNPFTDQTSIELNLNKNKFIRFHIYTSNGLLVKTIAEDFMEEGSNVFHWDGKDDFGTRVPKGLYLYRVESRKTIVSGKIIRY